jgi:DNA-binding NarL/FixJ family response regulator
MTAGQSEPARERTARVLLVDDHRTFTDLLALALRGESDLEFVGAAHRATEAEALVAKLRPDVVVMDVNIGPDDGIELTARLTAAYPELSVVVLTAHADSALMQRAVQAGACGLLPKDGSLPEMLNGLRSARPGGLVVHPTLLRILVSTSDASGPTTSRPAAEPTTVLTRREEEVLRMLAEGRDARTIARALDISLHTCRGYVKTLLMKLDAHSQLEAVAIATRQGLLGDDRNQ